MTLLNVAANITLSSPFQNFRPAFLLFLIYPLSGMRCPEKKTLILWPAGKSPSRPGRILRHGKHKPYASF